MHRFPQMIYVLCFRCCMCELIILIISGFLMCKSSKSFTNRFITIEVMASTSVLWVQ